MRDEITEGDLQRVLILLPSPLFRHADIYTAARELGFGMHRGQAFWHRLAKEGRIVRTAIPIGLARHRFYWERTPSSESACR